VSPATEPRHNLAADRLRTLLAAALPPGAEAIRNCAVQWPGGPGPTPDLLVTTADPDYTAHGVPAAEVHTLVDVVGRGGRPAAFPAAGIPCVWRVELRPWWEHLCPTPAIVVRRLDAAGHWHTTLHPAGETAALPVQVTRHDQVTVTLDPAVLVGRRSLAPLPRS